MTKQKHDALHRATKSKHHVLQYCLDLESTPLDAQKKFLIDTNDFLLPKRGKEEVMKGPFSQAINSNWIDLDLQSCHFFINSTALQNAWNTSITIKNSKPLIYGSCKLLISYRNTTTWSTDFVQCNSRFRNTFLFLPSHKQGALFIVPRKMFIGIRATLCSFKHPKKHFLFFAIWLIQMPPPGHTSLCTLLHHWIVHSIISLSSFLLANFSPLQNYMAFQSSRSP